MDRTLLEKKSVAELREIAAALGLRGVQRLKKAELVDRIVSSAGEAREAPEDEASINGHGGTDTEVADEAPADAAPANEDRADEGRGDRGDRADEGRGDEGRADVRPARDQRDERAAEGDHRRERDSDDGRHERGDDRGARDRDRGGRDRKRGRPRGDNDTRGPNDDPEAEVREGVLDLLPEGYGFLRCTGYLAGAQDVYVSQSFVRRFDLRRGDLIAGPIRRNRNSDKFPALARVDRIEGVTFDPRADEPRRPAFGDLTALSPSERLVLERPGGPLSLRVMDLLTPIGRGQRGLVVAPPRAGKTTLLKQLAAALEGTDPDVHVVALFVDARPEEVTDLEQSCDAEVVATTFEQSAEDHTQIAELVIERAKRLVERGRDVVVLFDSLTRLTRAYNIVVPSSGRVLPGGLDPAALYPAKRLFAAARNVEGAGSLTIVATALTGDGSRMDEVIVEGFADTANMELHLDGGLAQQRILPAVDLVASGTRGEERLLSEAELTAVARLRRDVAGLALEDAMPRVLDRLEQAGSNDRFVTDVVDAGLG